jgi:hypothetical protein
MVGLTLVFLDGRVGLPDFRFEFFFFNGRVGLPNNMVDFI